MARHSKNQFTYAYRPGTVVIEGYLTVVAGSPTTMAVTDCPGVTSVARTGAGAYTITLDEAALDVVGFQGAHHPDSGAVAEVAPATLAVATRKTEALASTFKFVCKTPASGSAVELTATDLVWVRFVVQRAGCSR